MNTNLSTVKAIGAAIRKTETAVPLIVATLPADFDPSKRGAVSDAVHAWACGDTERPAVKTGAKGSQKSTDYGRGVDALTQAVKRALSDDSTKPVALRATLSGEGGGSVTLDMSSDLGLAVLALIREGQES